MTDRAMYDYFERIEDSFVMNTAGDEVFWPTGNNGYYDAFVLRAIADELDKRNGPWNDMVEEYFENHPYDLKESDIGFDFEMKE